MTLQKQVKELTTNIHDNQTIADELYRIHCYSSTLAKLCSTGSSDSAIDPEQLEQIFKDIAEVTDAGASALSKVSENALESETNPDPFTTPFIKHHDMMGKMERIYVPEYVEINDLTPTEILSQGVILPEKYNHYKVKDFKLWLHAKDSFKEVYLLVPLFEKRMDSEDQDTFHQRVGIQIVRECVQR
ncbi:hypothetical protein GCM10016272_01470 [Psychrobacter glaciei]|uniref:Uncharacterized protein n=1 Tax=Psychrobacter glaciei TaxID=619771 RepID=A0ABQ3GLN5_9GAMM|nr:hypothetical protein [Psychrobacter glaciei]GHD25542.1 hypothetical protein GCM10016272_01470 [Psychrobacter glaciei]